MKQFTHKSILGIALCSPLLLLSIGCAGGSIGNPPPVSAQQTYSVASLSGTYSLNEIGTTNGQLHDGSGTLQFDGKGNLTGTISDFYVGTNACVFSAVGTYTLSSSANGTATVTTTSTDPACAGAVATVNLQVAQQGQALVFAETDGQRLDTGSAIKQ